MKIGILTFSSAINYGAVLQAYGLKTVLEEMGCEVAVIDYRPKYIGDFYKPFNDRPGFLSLLKPKGWVYWGRYFRNAIRKAINNNSFERFGRKYLNLDSHDWSTIHGKYDLIICGSDQIWNPNITDQKIDPIFWGQSPLGKFKRIISYGASVGNLDNIVPFRDEFFQKLRYLSAISTREQNLADYINDSDTEVKAEVVLDPTILAGRSAFEKICDTQITNEPYILVFDLLGYQNHRQIAAKVSKTIGLPILELRTVSHFYLKERPLRIASPEQFCTLIKNASCVVTNSFHGTAFSVLFNRNFVFLEDSRKRNERVRNLLKPLGLLDRIKNDGVIRQYDLEREIDWAYVNSKLESLRKGSINFLRNSICE